jgi:dihydrofolate reductase
MRKLIVNEFLSMDGVAQAPSGREEDPSGGFAHGGWHAPQDERARAWVMKYVAEMGALVLGRRTYEIFAGYWPNAPEEVAVVAEPFNRSPKYVASDLVDELRLMIDPLVLGGGKRIFPEDRALRRFRLTEHEFTNDGAILATYSRQRTLT